MNNSVPICSVIIPVYNREKYVSRAIDSVIKQPRADQIELIIVDDGSKDKSGTICDDYAKCHRNITVLHKKNGGVSAARNAGIKIATGLNIAVLDSDDWWEPGFFDTDIVDALSQSDCDKSNRRGG